MKFEELKVGHTILKGLKDLGFESPTPVQESAIPLMMQGSDVIIQSQTGTGKTIAFGIPLIETLEASRHIQSLVLVPTRELALQVSNELRNVGKYSQFSMVAVYGGEGIGNQIRALERGVQILIATPGRLLDHLERRTVDLSKVKIVVLDEADRMLDMGFIDDIKKIFEFIPKHRQTALFSATMAEEIVSLARKIMHTPEIVKLSRDTVAVEKIKQEFAFVDDKKKIATLASLLDERKPKLAIVFVKTKRSAEWLNRALKSRGLLSIELHGNLSQNQRERAVTAFKKAHANVLVATDIAARGLDVSGVELVVNFNLPENHETYVHRIGRTARAGNEGSALTLVTNLEEKREVDRISHQIKAKITEATVTINEKFMHGSAQEEERPHHSGGFGRRPFRSGGGHFSRGAGSSRGGEDRGHGRPSHRRSNGYSPRERRY